MSGEQPVWSHQTGARLGAAADPEGGRDGGMTAFVLARAIYKVSIEGHGGAVLDSFLRSNLLPYGYLDRTPCRAGALV
jgi:hypothetical protein